MAEREKHFYFVSYQLASRNPGHHDEIADKLRKKKKNIEIHAFPSQWIVISDLPTIDLVRDFLAENLPHFDRRNDDKLFVTRLEKDGCREINLGLNLPDLLVS